MNRLIENNLQDYYLSCKHKTIKRSEFGLRTVYCKQEKLLTDSTIDENYYSKRSYYDWRAENG